MPAASSASTSPATSGASGPTTTRSTSRSRARHEPATSSADIEARGVRRDARVARRAQQLGRLRAAQQRADDRVLAPAAADDQDPLELRARR